ncbi:MAG: Preprotein translocase SecG subunit, partial [Deltaproteobacteria bacterium]|nr:Preprotein translocase SecG subunit [Deltaproteobacteria bacterium]
MTIIIVLHILVCIALILIVLLQAGKGAEMGAAFGGASQTIFGSAG